MNYQVTSSGLLSADAAVCATGSRVHSVVLIPDGTNACSVIVYDNASAASGLVLAKLVLPASSTAPQVLVHDSNPITADKGIFCDVSGTGAAYIVTYSIGA